MPKKGKKKKSKKSKEELEAERLAKEEEERLALEAELKRQEEERIRREEEERIRRESEAKRRKEELERLNEQVDASRARVSNRSRALNSILKAQEDERSWRVYMECRKTPEASSEPELNAYLNQWEDDSEHDLDTVLDVCQEAETIVAELERIISSARASNDHAAVSKYSGFLAEYATWSCAKLRLCDSAHLAAR